MDDRCVVSRRLIAQGPVCTVEECSCGVLHVTLGALTIRLQREAVGSIFETLGEALGVTRSAPVEPNVIRRPRTDRPS